MTGNPEIPCTFLQLIPKLAFLLAVYPSPSLPPFEPGEGDPTEYIACQMLENAEKMLQAYSSEVKSGVCPQAQTLLG